MQRESGPMRSLLFTACLALAACASPGEQAAERPRVAEVIRDLAGDIPAAAVLGEGWGMPVSRDAPLEVQRQEAFIAALVDGVRNIVVVKEPPDYAVSDRPDRIVTAWKGTVGDFEIDDQMIVYEALARDGIHCRYRGQKILVIDGQLRFPDVGMLRFPRWEKPPETISGMAIEKIVAYEDGSMEVQLSFRPPDRTGP